MVTEQEIHQVASSFSKRSGKKYSFIPMEKHRPVLLRHESCPLDVEESYDSYKWMDAEPCCEYCIFLQLYRPFRPAMGWDPYEIWEVDAKTGVLEKIGAVLSREEGEKMKEYLMKIRGLSEWKRGQRPDQRR